jgi:hypothetical protein
MFKLSLFELLANSPDLTPGAVQLFCRLVVRKDMRYPSALKKSSGDLREHLDALIQAGVLVKCGRIGRGTRINASLYRVPEKWWLTADEIAQVVDEGERLKGREGLFEAASLLENEPTSSLSGEPEELAREPLSSPALDAEELPSPNPC